MRKSRELTRAERTFGHVQTLESGASDFEFDEWLDRLLELNIGHLEALFQQQLRFFSGSDRGYRSRGDEEVDLPINRILWTTQDLQLEMIDLALLRSRLATHIKESGLHSARNAIRQRH